MFPSFAKYKLRSLGYPFYFSYLKLHIRVFLFPFRSTTASLLHYTNKLLSKSEFLPSNTGVKSNVGESYFSKILQSSPSGV
mgnify:CR=1 FL=1